MANDTIDIITEVREVRENGVLAAIAWGVTLASACLAIYTPLGNLKAVFIILAFIGAVGGLGGIWYTAAFVFHASTVLVLRVKPVWRLPVQIAIALAVPCLLSLYFLRTGMPTWATVETMFSWYSLLPLALIAMFSKSAGSKLDRTVPVRGFIIAAAILFVIMWLHSRGFSTNDGSYGGTGVYFDAALATQPGRMANIFVHYLVYVTTSYGTMLFFFRKASEASQVPQKRPKFGDMLIGAIAVVSIYGKVLEEQSHLYGVAIPVSRLPFPKDHVKTAIQIVYSSIQKEVAREIIKERLPQQSAYILSDKYRESLIVGYSCLPGFVPDEEAEAVKALFEKVDREIIEKILNNPEQYHEEIAEAARMIADTNVIEIIIRINAEGMDYLTELEKYDKRFCDEVNNDS